MQQRPRLSRSIKRPKFFEPGMGAIQEEEFEGTEHGSVAQLEKEVEDLVKGLQEKDIERGLAGITFAEDATLDPFSFDLEFEVKKDVLDEFDEDKHKTVLDKFSLVDRATYVDMLKKQFLLDRLYDELDRAANQDDGKDVARSSKTAWELNTLHHTQVTKKEWERAKDLLQEEQVLMEADKS